MQSNPNQGTEVVFSVQMKELNKVFKASQIKNQTLEYVEKFGDIIFQDKSDPNHLNLVGQPKDNANQLKVSVHLLSIADPP